MKDLFPRSILSKNNLKKPLSKGQGMRCPKAGPFISGVFPTLIMNCEQSQELALQQSDVLPQRHTPQTTRKNLGERCREPGLAQKVKGSMLEELDDSKRFQKKRQETPLHPSYTLFEKVILPANCT